MPRTILRTGLIGFVSYSAFGQPPATPPAFEVASVKAVKMQNAEGGKGRESVESSPGSLNMRNVSLTSCLKWAFDVKDYQISGPGWLGSDRYDIAAKAAGPAPDSQMKPMLQALLADRFKLTFHREQKELQVYALIQGKNPPKLHQSDDHAEGGAKIAGSKVTFGKISMAQLADMLTRQMDRPVLDMTGLTGVFDFTIDTSASMDGGPSSKGEQSPAVQAKMMSGTGLLPIVQEQLGLKVEGRKLPADVLVIDHADRIPTEN